MTADPPLRLDRRRRIRPGSVSEELVVSSVLDTTVEVAVTLRLEADFAPIEVIKVGDTRPAHGA